MPTTSTTWAAAALGAAIIALPAFSTAQADQKVGVAAAVKPEATSQQPGRHLDPQDRQVGRL
jgi:hypothetical protein